MYNYKNSKQKIIGILTSKTPIEKKEKIPADVEFTFENGILCWVGAIFIDIENSSSLFNTKDEKLARLMRAFTSEVITIMQDKSEYSQIGIRGESHIENQEAILYMLNFIIRTECLQPVRLLQKVIHTLLR